jgi:hypothetical protein
VDLAEDPLQFLVGVAVEEPHQLLVLAGERLPPLAGRALAAVP